MTHKSTTLILHITSYPESPFLQPKVHNVMSITVGSFKLKANSSVAKNNAIKNIFIEYQFLNFDYGELETPSSLPKPQEGQAVQFNFRKGSFKVSATSK